MPEKTNTSSSETCPKCGSPLGEIITTKSQQKLQRCSQGSWDPETKKTVGCSYVKWLPFEPQELDEDCPLCHAKLILAVTRFGKKMKKCSQGSWDKEKKQAVGCPYVSWINGTTEETDEMCPECGNRLVLFTTTKGKKMKKCSTAGWDSKTKSPTGCTYVQWLKPNEYSNTFDNAGEEYLPPEPTA